MVLDYLREILETLDALIGRDILVRIGESLLLLLLYMGVRLLISRATRTALKIPERRYQVHKYARLALNVVFFLSLFQVWLNRSWSIASFIGLLSAGLAIVLREPLLNLAGWLFIVTRRPFVLGQRLQVADGPRGDVVDIGVNDFTLMEIGNWVDADQSTGRLVHVPNSVVFTKHLANYSKAFPYLWNEISVPVTFESDWEEAARSLERIAGEICTLTPEEQAKVKGDLHRTDTYFIAFTHLTPIVYVQRRDQGIELTLRHLCIPKNRRGMESAIWKAILKDFTNSQQYQLAYPTQRIVLDQPPAGASLPNKDR
ncbi:MAG: mechanosensitive ion channel family protein [Vulcanimicrobiota bacterium]